MVAAAPAERDEYYSGSDSEESGGSDGSFSRILPIVGRRLSLPDFRADVGVKYVKVGYRLVCRNTFAFGLLMGLMAIGVQLLRMAEIGEMSNLWKTAVQTRVEQSMVQTIGWSVALAFGLAAYLFSRRTPVYLVDFSVLRPPEEWKKDLTELKKIARHRFCKTQGAKRTEELMDFMCNKIHKNAGVTSVGTYLPPGITDPSQEATMENSRKESEVVLFTLFEDLLKKTGITAKDVDILIVNCSLFNPTPSMTAMIVNKFKLRSNVQSYNLSGMGCR